MPLVHWITRLRYQIKFYFKLNIRDDIWEDIIKFYYYIPYLKKGILSTKKDKKVIISLTTIPERLGKVWLTTESLLRQRKKPDKIILWLGKDEFDGIEIPKLLKSQQRRGLEIRYCKNLKSYKKFYYTMLEYRNDYVLIVDDDFIYSEKMLEEMIDVSNRYPNSIVCNHAHKIRGDKNGIFPYLRWIRYENRKIKESFPTYQNFFTGCGGVLFPVWLLDDVIFRQDIFMKIAPTADDVWLNFNAWKSKLKIVMTKDILGYMIPIHSSSDKGLFLSNTDDKMSTCKCENDFQIKNVLEYLNLDIKEYI